MQKDNTFPDYHKLAFLNKYVYLVSNLKDLGRNVYIFRFGNKNGAIVGISENKDYFKGTVKPIIFTDDYNWDEMPETYTLDTWDRLVVQLKDLSGIGVQ